MLTLYSELPPILWKDIENLAILAPHWPNYTKKEKDIALTKNLFLDNMVYESTPLSDDDYFEIVKELSTAYFVLPDVINDEKETLVKHISFLQKIMIYNSKLRNNAMVVIQAIPSFKFIEWIVKEKLDYICIPYLLNIDRYLLIKDILRKIDKYNKNKTYVPSFHLLGIEHISEIYLYSKESKYVPRNMNGHMFITSADSGILYYSTVSENCKTMLNWDKFKLNKEGWNEKITQDKINFFKSRVKMLREETNWKI